MEKVTSKKKMQGLRKLIMLYLREVFQEEGTVCAKDLKQGHAWSD